MTTPLFRTKQQITIPPDARVICYARVSTEDQARGDRVSLPDQREAAEAWAAAHGLKVDVVVEDHASGSKINRPGFQAVLQHCRQHPRANAQRGVVLVWDGSRWGRFPGRPTLGQSFADELWRECWDLEYVKEPTTGDADADAFMGVARGVTSAQYLLRIRRNARTGGWGQARLARWQGRCPFGYRREAVSSVTGRVRTLEPGEKKGGKEEWVRLVPGDPRDVATVKKLFGWSADGITCVEIALRLNKERAPGPWIDYAKGNWRSGRTPCWTEYNVRALLQNVAVTGTFQYGRRGWSDEKHTRKLTPDERLVIPAAFPAIIDPVTFARVQEHFQRRQGLKQRKVPYLLAGLLVCERCGAKMNGGGGTRPKAADPLACTFYRCPTCVGPRVTLNRPWIEGRVTGLVSAHIRSMVGTGQFDRALEAAFAAGQHQSGDGGQALKREIGSLIVRRDRLVEAVAAGTLKDDEAKAKLDEVRRRLEELTAQSQRRRFAALGRSLTAQERERARALAVDFRARLGKVPIDLAREWLAAWIAEIRVDARNPAARVGRVALRKAPVQVFESTIAAGRALVSKTIQLPPGRARRAG